MLERALRLIRPQTAGPRLHWLSADIAVGAVSRPEDWASVYEAGVRAVVDLREESRDLGSEVRQNGMRYLRLCLLQASVPSAEELQIVASWVLERKSEDSRVLIHDAQARCNDGLVAVATLIKGGLPAHLALLALRRAAPRQALDASQHAELVRFAAAQ